jgi:hypothetical protein
MPWHRRKAADLQFPEESVFDRAFLHGFLDDIDIIRGKAVIMVP